MKQELDKKKEADEKVYILKNNIHFKNQCVIDVDNGVFLKWKKNEDAAVGAQSTAEASSVQAA